MRPSLFLASVFAAGVLAAPVIETKNVFVVHTVVVTQEGAPTPTPQPAPQVNQVDDTARVYTFFNGRQKFRYSWYWKSPAETPKPAPKPTETETPAATVTPAAEKESVTPPAPAPTPAIEEEAEIAAADEPEEPEESSTPPTPPPSSTPRPPRPSETRAAEPEAPAADDGSPLSGGVSLLTTANKWRAIYDLPPYTWDSQLEKNALKTGVDGGGVTQTHQLGPGTNGQVITPGIQTAKTDLQGDTPFELAYVAWLCEVPSDKLKTGGVDQCALVSETLFMVYSSTGHYDILTSESYSKIGCAFAPNPNAASDSPWTGLWVCDLGI